MALPELRNGGMGLQTYRAGEFATELRMNKVKITAGVTIFILFFGLALVEAFEKRNWLEAGIFLLLGIVFFLADRKKST